jgi:hypothetical protein
MRLYARNILLRNCGRFTHVSSDFGSQYHTHTFVTSEALYASLTREITWRHPGKFVDLEEDGKKVAGEDYFFCDYDVQAKPIWFTPGVFVDEQLRPLAKERSVVDRNDFNVVDEGYPGTGGKRIDGKERRFFCPTYGRIESILADHRLQSYAVSPRPEELEWFRIDQVFLMGKKRTMFQVCELSPITSGIEKHGYCATGWLELSPTLSNRFQSFGILAATMRYIILRGVTREKVNYVEFVIPDIPVFRLPDFYLEQTPIRECG